MTNLGLKISLNLLFRQDMDGRPWTDESLVELMICRSKNKAIFKSKAFFILEHLKHFINDVNGLRVEQRVP